MILLELFNNPYRWEQIGRNKYAFVPDGEDYNKKNQYTVLFDRYLDETTWVISFKRGAHQYEVVGGVKNPSRVMATVLDIIRHWVKKVNPKRVAFMSGTDERSRIKLYQRMVDAMVSQFGFKLEQSYVDDMYGEFTWFLVREQ